MKHAIHSVLNDPRNRHFSKINDFLAIMTIVSILGIVLETVPQLVRYHDFFYAVELITVLFFTIEYLLRVYAAPARREYIFSFFGLVDLLAILPTFIGFTNLTFLKSARVLRLLRLLRMVRLAKLARLRRTNADAEHAASIYRLNLEIYFTVLFASVLLFGSLMYVFEAPHQGFTSIPEGMIWAAETLLGGSIVGNLPETVPGQLLGILTRFTGLTLLGMLIYVVGHFLNNWLFGDKAKAKRKHTRK